MIRPPLGGRAQQKEENKKGPKRKNAEEKRGQSPLPTVNTRGAGPYTNRREDSPRDHLSTAFMASDGTPSVDTADAATLPDATPVLPAVAAASPVLSVSSSPLAPGVPATCDGEPLPVTPDWLLRAAQQPPLAATEADACPVCMCAVPDPAVTPSTFVVSRTCVRTVVCPFRFAVLVGPQSVAEERCLAMCARLSVALPEVAPSYDTRSAPSPGSVAPPPPPSVVRPASCVLRPASGVRRPASGVRRPASGVRRPASGVRRPAFGVWRLASASGVWRLRLRLRARVLPERLFVTRVGEISSIHRFT